MKQSLIILTLIPAWGSSFFVPTTRNGDNHRRCRHWKENNGVIITTTTTTATTSRLLLEKIEENNKNELWNLERVDKITDWVDGLKKYPNPLSLKPNIPLSWFVDDDDAVAAKVQVDAHETDRVVEPQQDGGGVGKRNRDAFILAGPRLDIAFDPKCCKADIVTCGKKKRKKCAKLVALCFLLRL